MILVSSFSKNITEKENEQEEKHVKTENFNMAIKTVKRKKIYKWYRSI
jgi:hypothetical protein